MANRMDNNGIGRILHTTAQFMENKKKRGRTKKEKEYNRAIARLKAELLNQI
jgi:hypothetical protein